MKITGEEYGNLVRPAVFYFRPSSVGALRTAGRMLDALDDLGTPTGPMGPDGFVPMVAGGDVELAMENGERGILVEALQQLAVHLPVGATRKLPALLDRINSE